MGKRIEYSYLERFRDTRLRYIKDIPKRDPKQRRALFLCDCGNTTEAEIYAVRHGTKYSCGCLNRERITTHGMSRTRLYKIWQDMHTRCKNPNARGYKNYGGRGIAVCKEWETFEPFLEWAIVNGYKENLTIDRINNNGNYTMNNCTWSNKSTQNINRRKLPNTSSRYVGVCKIKDKEEWVSYVANNSKFTSIGTFTNEGAAALARNIYILKNKLPNRLNQINEPVGPR